MPTIFDRIIAGDIPGHFVLRETRWVAFLDIAPVAPGHVLLVPREGVAHLADLSPATLADLGRLAAALTAALKAELSAPAVTVLLRDGAAAGQEVPHVHWHFIPRHDRADCHRFAGGSYGATRETATAAAAAMAARLATRCATILGTHA